ncbi:MAG: C25 family cysteine peptidase [Planctomycetota bacterium]
MERTLSFSTRRWALAVAALLLSLAPPSQAEQHAVVVCPAEWQPLLGEWLALRRTPWRRVTVLAPADTAEAMASVLVKAAGNPPPRWIVLIGDCPADGPADPARNCPTWTRPAPCGQKWGGQAELVTDHPYTRLWPNAGHVAIARLPVDSPEELQSYLARVVAYERRSVARHEDHRLTVVASPGRFSPLVDRIIESTAASMLAGLTPPECGLHLTYADWRSVYCPFPPLATDAVRRGLQTRSLAWLYLGHGRRDELDRLRTPLGSAVLLDRRSTTLLRGVEAPTLAALVACDAGAFDGPDDCLAEDLIRQPGGPLAALASSRVCMPYGNSVLGLELLDELFRGGATIGECVAAAKHRITSAAEPEQDTSSSTAVLRKTLERIAAGFVAEESARQQERQEHVELYNLLGDPMLTIRRPEAIELAVAKLAADGRSIRIEGASPLAGRCRVSVRPPRGSVALRSGREELRLDSDSRDRFNKTYAAANRLAISEGEVDTPAGVFAIDLPIAEAVEGPLVAVAVVAGENGLAAGSIEVER